MEEGGKMLREYNLEKLNLNIDFNSEYYRKLEKKKYLEEKFSESLKNFFLKPKNSVEVSANWV
jgi:hypothetical protein